MAPALSLGIREQRIGLPARVLAGQA